MLRAASSRHLPSNLSPIRRHFMRPLTLDQLNQQLQTVEYAVRGEIAIRADQLRDQLKHTDNGLAFTEVISSNIGNPQQKGLDQKPITFTRQVAALMEWPELADKVTDESIFPPDVRARAKELRDNIGSIGAYSHSQGVPFIRQQVAAFIKNRDSAHLTSDAIASGAAERYAASPDDIFLTAGASAGVSLLLNLLITDPTDGVLIPIPQYPLYTAALAQHHGSPVPYFLNEDAEWATDVDGIQAALDAAEKAGTKVKALVVINPGNPTGGLLSEGEMRSVIELCDRNGLVLLADEVYQDNIHDRGKHAFVSFKRVLRDMQAEAKAAGKSEDAVRVPLVSFHSISKGVSGECGRRGGYFELTNVTRPVRDLVYKLVSVGLCPPLSGQIGVDSMVRPPKEGDASYALWKEETSAIHAALAARTKTIAQGLNALEGVSCVQSPGALYLFPRITLPKAAIKAAEAQGKAPDAVYAMELLEATGICVVPGSGFRQKEGEWHYRLTCLCPGTDAYVDKLVKFHEGYLAKWKGQ